MVTPIDPLGTAGPGIRQILHHTHVGQADVLVEKYGETSQHETFRNGDGGEREEITENDGPIIYGIGSLTKLIIALLLSIIVDKLSLSDELGNESYRRLRQWNRDPWDVIFTTLFNSFSEMKIEPLAGNPSLRHVFLHINALTPMNFILLAPDGTSLMSAKEFIDVAPHLVAATHSPKDSMYNAYSNGNYILIGLLIEAIAPKGATLQNLVAKYILGPLGMTHTYMNRTELGNVLCARPHVVSASGRRELIGAAGYHAGAIVNPAMAAYSTTRDLATLFRNLQRCIDGDDSTFSQELVQRLLKPEITLDTTDPENGKQTACGFYAALHTSILGLSSVNRIMTPNQVCSTYRLGLRDGNEVCAYFMAGAVNGYTSCFHFIPKQRTFVVVLTDTSGGVDAADHISRLILQDIFDLRRTPSTLGYLAWLRIQASSDLHISDIQPKVDIPNMSSRAAKECQKILEQWNAADAQESKPNMASLHLDGAYRCELTRQLIVIRSGDGRVIVNVKGGAGSSTDMGLNRTGNLSFQLYPLSLNGFTIDRYDTNGWKGLDFNMTMERDGDGSQRVATITRNGCPIPSMGIYMRTSENFDNLG